MVYMESRTPGSSIVGVGMLSIKQIFQLFSTQASIHVMVGIVDTHCSYIAHTFTYNEGIHTGLYPS